MGKPKLTLVCYEEKPMEVYYKDLSYFFGDYADIECYNFSTKPPPATIISDVIVISNINLTSILQFHIPFNYETEFIYLRRAFKKEKLNKLSKLPLGTKAMFVDYTNDTAMDMIFLLNEIGIRNIEFFPVYKGISEKQIEELKNKNINLSITPGIHYFIPSHTEEIIDINWAVTEVPTLLEIALKLGVYNKEIEDKLFSYSEKVVSNNKGVIFAIKNMWELNKANEMILDFIEDGICIINEDFTIIGHNNSFINIMNMMIKNIKGKKIHNLIVDDKLRKKIASQNTFENFLYRFPKHKKDIMLTKRKTKYNNKDNYLIIVKEAKKIQQQENKIRQQLINKGHIAKYRFDDIVGDHPLLLSCIKKAKIISQTDATILIEGETGTGKEVFAQSIHNDSLRKNMPFVPINCAAISPSLLESELFGYDGGAFTSAKKEGQVGLFETAHKGTLFLDEISEIPINMQTKLLRVIEEKAIRRVGGFTQIPVDVRLIAATNQDLMKLVNEKKFRKDLYYRLNVIPIYLPPLRKRITDIELLVPYILSEIKKTEININRDVMNILLAHDWKGNVRELVNCIEYMVHLAGDNWNIEDLPPSIYPLNPIINKDGNVDMQSAKTDYHDLNCTKKILEILNSKRIGREKLTILIQGEEPNATEYQVRKLIEQLREDGIVTYGKGRGGISLTIKGKEFLNSLY